MYVVPPSTTADHAIQFIVPRPNTPLFYNKKEQITIPLLPRGKNVKRKIFLVPTLNMRSYTRSSFMNFAQYLEFTQILCSANLRKFCAQHYYCVNFITLE